MIHSWKELTNLTNGSRLVIERVRLVDKGIAIEGEFDPPSLAQLTEDDQIFVAAFVRCHGSIKQMEKFFGVSYPTIKNRLNRIGELLPLAEVDYGENSAAADLLARLDRGELNVKEVLDALGKKEQK